MIKKLGIVLATWFGCGYSPIGPGTVGTLGTIPLYILLGLAFGTDSLLYLLTIAAFFAIAVWSAGVAEEHFGEHDSQKIVIDESIGFLIAVAYLPFGWVTALFGVIFFRIFDIAKPPPVDWADEKIGGPLGTVLDDVLAGLYAQLVMQLILHFFPGWYF